MGFGRYRFAEAGASVSVRERSIWRHGLILGGREFWARGKFKVGESGLEVPCWAPHPALSAASHPPNRLLTSQRSSGFRSAR